MSSRKTQEMTYWYLRQILPEKPGVDSVQLSVLVELLDQHAEEAKAEQRQMCADAVLEELERLEIVDSYLPIACLNATGENDDK